MIRLIVIEVALFLAPFLVFAAFLVARRRALSVGLFREEAPMIELAVGGLVLVVFSLIALATFHDGTAAGTYVPDRFENGRLVPGRIQ
ncbi:MAG: DUF6111 family protein [Siculibacillus sp.]|nr:DUF6111 family protein [Siculibacillus sp.]